MLTASVATTTENIANPTTTGWSNLPTSFTGSQIGAPKMIALALVIKTPIAAKRNIVVGSATVCPIACSLWLRPKRVKSGMLRESVAQNPIMAVSDGTKTGRNSASVWYLPGCDRSGPNP